MKNFKSENIPLVLQVIRRLQFYWLRKLDTYPYLKPRDIETITYIHLSETPVTMMDLACHLNVSPSAITQMVTSMERKHILQKEPCREDHRIHYLKLHPKLMSTINEENLYFIEKLERFKEFAGDEFDVERLLDTVVAFMDHEQELERKNQES